MILITDYIKEKRLELSASILKRTIIYFDTKFWNNLRKGEKSIDQQLLAKAIELTESKKCIFPISEITLWEILKQGDAESRDRTIDLMDRLSEGVAIINSAERKILETTHFIELQRGNYTHELNKLVWSKASYIFDYHFYLSQIKSREHQKLFFNVIGNLSMLEVVKFVNNRSGLKAFKFKDNVDALNENKQKYKDQNNSFEDMFLSELAGCIDLPDDSMKTSIFNAFKDKKVKNELPIFQITSMLFAGVRWNKNQKFRDGNDTMDFLHASFALPYCNFFFTENKLQSLIIQLKLDRLYNCKVVSKQEDALEILQAIK